jgi:DNA-binding transcriptional LysR family regulator
MIIMEIMNKIERSQLDSDLLRTFVVIAETGNLTQAANYLNRTQSAISVQVKKLEESFATQLFYRQPRGMLLTEEGHKLLPEARTLVADLNRIAGLFSNKLSGRIALGVPDDCGLDILSSSLRHFLAQNPEVEVTVRCSLSTQFPQAIQAGELDLALYLASPNEGYENILWQEENVWVADESLHLSSDQTVPLAVYDRECWWRDAAIRALEESGRQYRVAFSSESIAGIKTAVNAGIAVAMLSINSVEPHMKILTKVDGFPPLPSSAIVLLRHDTQSQLCNAMEDTLREMLILTKRSA